MTTENTTPLSTNEITPPPGEELTRVDSPGLANPKHNYHIHDQPNIKMTLNQNDDVLSQMQSLLSPHVETFELDGTQLKVVAYLVIPEPGPNEGPVELSVHWVEASGLDMEAYVFYYEQTPSTSLRKENRIYKVEINREVHANDSFALMKFILWNGNPRTSRGTVTTVQTPTT